MRLLTHSIRLCRAGGSIAELQSKISRALTSTRGQAVDPKHLERMKKMYGKAPINNLFNEHIINYAPDGQTSIDFTPGKEHCHTMMSLHGSGYFKLLDDAAFFAAQAQDDTNFIFTTSFNTYLIRAVVPGTELVSKGWVTSGGKSLIIAESRLEEKETGKLVASGSGTFQKSPHQLPAYE